jgi:protein transport protein SEC61 subunit alpha
MIYAGHRDSSMLNILKRYIPVAATFGGICVGILTIIADLMGAIGSGLNIYIFLI